MNDIQAVNIHDLKTQYLAEDKAEAAARADAKSAARKANEWADRYDQAEAKAENHRTRKAALLLSLRQAVEAAHDGNAREKARRWWGWWFDNLGPNHHSRKDAEALLRLAGHADPEAALESENAAKRARMAANRAMQPEDETEESSSPAQDDVHAEQDEEIQPEDDPNDPDRGDDYLGRDESGEVVAYAMVLRREGSAVDGGIEVFSLDGKLLMTLKQEYKPWL